MPLFSRRKSEVPSRVAASPPVLPSVIRSDSAPLVPWTNSNSRIAPNRLSTSTTTSGPGRASTSSSSQPSEVEEYTELCRPAYEILSDYMENPIGTLGVSRLVTVDINRKPLEMSNRRLLMMTLDLVDEIHYRQTHGPGSKREWHRVPDKRREQARVQFASMSPTGILSVVRNTHAEIGARFPSLMYISGVPPATDTPMDDIPPSPISSLQRHGASAASAMPQRRLPASVPPPSLPPPPPPPPPPPRRDNDDGLCVICCDSRANTLLVSCRHLSMCGDCADAIILEADPRCPVCRTAVGDPAVSVIRVFLT